MKTNIVFVVMSAVHNAEAVAELARALAPHTVLVHHDFAQTPKFHVGEPNVIFVPEPKRTGWAIWGFVDGIFHALRYAHENLQFDYLQVLSPTCLPIKPISRFEEQVSSGQSEANCGWVGVLDDRDALMTVGCRAFSPDPSFRHRVLRRMSAQYYGQDSSRRDVAGVQLRSGGLTDTGGKLTWRARAALIVMTAASRRLTGPHAFSRDFRPYYGSTWFGAQRQVIAWMLKRFDQPDIQRYFPRMRIADEFLIPTLLKNGGFKVGPFNHCIVTFVDSNPRWLSDEDFVKLQQSPAFFARKFPDDPASPIRGRVLTELAQLREPPRLAAPQPVAVP
jgi:hypothetical protein